MVGGGFSSIAFNLKQMACPPESKFTYEEMSEAIAKRIDKLKLPAIGDIKSLDINKVRLNKDAYPGFVSDMSSGSTRGATALYSSAIARYQIRKIFANKKTSMDI